MSEKSSIREKIAKLDELMAWFDGDDFEIEEALEKFAEAKALAVEIEQNLSEIKNSIAVVSEQFDEE